MSLRVISLSHSDTSHVPSLGGGPMSQFNQQYQSQLQLAWEHFIQHDNRFDYSFIRPVIFESWMRSRLYDVNPYEKQTGILTGKQLEQLLDHNKQLIRIVRPYMERLFSIVEGSGYFLLLSDNQGYVLDIIGDIEMIEQAKASLLVVGANRSEKNAGTNAIGTCISIEAPIQIWNREHYITSHREYSCSSGPIFDDQGDLLGCLNITGKYSEVHTHTLGMVLSAVDGITKELKIRKAYDEIKIMSAQRNSILESVTSGLILLNESDQIIQMNGNATRMLHQNGKNAIGKNINQIISLDEPNQITNFYELPSSFSSKETNVYFLGLDSAPVKFRISVTFVGEDRIHDRGTVIRLEESQYIHKLVNKVGGFKASYTFDSIIGTSGATKKLVSNCQRAARSSSNVLILGESGTGKELAAQSIHNGSSYASGPFVAINCAALPKGLIESELFGYEKGAFTGASKEGNPGKFELADNGTIFLDEIGDMPLEVQASLLRVLQSKEVVRIGAKHPKKINVRIIAATNKNLMESVESKTFRQDLYYRLNVLAIQMPPLRTRGNDIIELAEYFIQNLNFQRKSSISLDTKTYPILKAYQWPGNIRELENAMERAINITDTNAILPEHLPANIYSIQSEGNSNQDRISNTSNRHNDIRTNTIPPESLDFYKAGYQLIVNSLERTDGNVQKAAELLGISRRTIYRKMDKYGIDYQAYRK